MAVTQATPNEGGDTGLIQVIPSAGQTAASTKALVRELRASRRPAGRRSTASANILVTGQTAINIDVSDRLGGALLPFACIVIGLSLILLMIVFRSIAVPIKATLGYLLSVGAALGAVVAVFQWGWLENLMGLNPGPVVSFLPIFVMGVLFGLAMDYEMFLVSAMREDYVQSGDPRRPCDRGFRASAKVVTAAALIMSSVFVAFIPSGQRDHQADRARTGRRGVRGRVHRPDDAGPGGAGAARPRGVVAARMARATSARGRRRGCGAAPQGRVRGLGGRTNGEAALMARDLVVHEDDEPCSWRPRPPR